MRHVKKRLGRRLRNKVKKYKGTKTPISDLFSMKKSVGAILWHCTDFNDQETCHRFCSQGSDSWCKYQKYESTDGSATYKEAINIPKSIFKIVKPIFVSLSSDDL